MSGKNFENKLIFAFFKAQPIYGRHLTVLSIFDWPILRFYDFFKHIQRLNSNNINPRHKVQHLIHQYRSSPQLSIFKTSPFINLNSLLEKLVFFPAIIDFEAHTYLLKTT